MASLVTAAPPQAAAGPGPARMISWLVAGDSYSSGQGLPYETGLCAQATYQSPAEPGAWGIDAAHLLAADGTITLAPGSPHMVACTGYHSAQFFDASSGNPAEWHSGDPTYDLVSLTFGGDDVGFSSVIRSCLGVSWAGVTTGLPSLLDNVPNGVSNPAGIPGNILVDYEAWVHDPLVHCPSNSQLRSRIASKQPSYQKHLLAIATGAVTPGGNVVVLGYPELVEDPAQWLPADKLLGMCQGIRPADARELRGLSGDLNATIAETVKTLDAIPANKRNDVTFTYVDVNTGDPSQGIPYADPNLFEPNTGPRHNLCAAQEWLNGITVNPHATPISTLMNRSFHPNQEGNDAMARLVEQVFGRLDWSHLRTPTLAALANGSLLLWKGGATSRIAPAPLAGSSVPQIVSSFEWSSDGRYLGFQEQASTSGPPDITAWYDTATRRMVSWSIGNTLDASAAWSITASGEEALQPASSAQSGATLTIFHLDGTTNQQTVPVPPSLLVSGSSAGFIVGPDPFNGDGGALEMVTLNGVVANLPSLPAAGPNSTPYEVQALSPDGQIFIAEQGDHTDGCGVGPPSQLFVVDIGAGSVHQVPLPIGPNWRVVSIAFDPDDTIDATMTNCGTSNNAVVFKISPLGALTASTPGALSMTSDAGMVATQFGGADEQSVGEYPGLVSTASSPVTINGQAVSGTASSPASIAWAP